MGVELGGFGLGRELRWDAVEDGCANRGGRMKVAGPSVHLRREA